MFCGYCGKKVHDEMRFCPFCGKEIIIPKQDDEEDIAAPTAKPAPAPVRRPVSIYELHDEPAEEEEPVKEDVQEEFEPLSFEFEKSAKAEEAQPEADETAPEQEEVAPAEIKKPAPVRTVPELKKEERPRANTFIPVKDTSLDELFLEDDEDDFDDDEYGDDDFDEREYDDRRQGGFFDRHIRGFIVLMVLLVILAACVALSFTDVGQKTLAKMNLAWKPTAYAELGVDAYNTQSYELAQKYFTRAYAMEQTNYDYAHNVMICAYNANDMETAKTMMMRCIELDPLNERGIRDEIRGVFPDAETRPWEIEELLNKYENEE